MLNRLIGFDVGGKETILCSSLFTGETLHHVLTLIFNLSVVLLMLLIYLSRFTTLPVLKVGDVILSPCQ